MTTDKREFFKSLYYGGCKGLPKGYYPFLDLKRYIRQFYPDIFKEFTEGWDETKKRLDK